MQSQATTVAASPPTPPSKRPNCLLWARHLALLPAEANLPSKLPRGALDLLEALSGHERRWSWIDYDRLSTRLGMSRRRVAYRVAELRGAGLVEIALRRSPRQHLDLNAGAVIGTYGTQVWARPLASCARGQDGRLNVYVSKGAEMTITSRGKHGGKRLGAGRKSKSRSSVVGQDEAAKYANPEYAPPEVGKSRSSILSLDLDPSSPYIKTSPEVRGLGAPRPAVSSSSEPEGSFDPDLIDLSSPYPGRLLPLPEEKRGPRPQVPAWDKVPMSFEGWHSKVPDMLSDHELAAREVSDPDLGGRLRIAQVMAVVRGYNLAARRVYGEGTPLLFHGTDVHRSKHYPKLLEAAQALCAHDIAPAAWATWRMRYALEQGEAKPPGLTRVMQPKTIVKLRGFFHKECDDAPSQTLLFERWHFEQMYRSKEAWRRWTYGPVNVLGCMSVPRWYADLRAGEIAAGIHDPLDCWPNKDRHSKAPNPRPSKGSAPQ